MKFLLLVCSFWVLNGCTNYVMISHGTANGVARVFGGAAQYCKLAASDPGYVFTELDKEMWRERCDIDIEKEIRDRLE